MGVIMEQNTEQSAAEPQSSTRDVFWTFLRLGLTSFGGPVAHIGYFREEFVVRRKWLDDRSYADLVALCQFLPGPASSQVGLAVGLSRAGYPGALAAWAGFTLPSALALILFAFGVSFFGDQANTWWLKGLKIAAVAVVAHAVWGMAQSLTPDKERATLAIIAAAIALLISGVWGQLAAIGLGAVAGLTMLRSAESSKDLATLPLQTTKSTALVALAIFFLLLLGLPILAAQMNVQGLSLFDSFYRSGSLVFGGGHVVLPLLQSEVVPPGLTTNDQFLAGYGAAQAVPGPLFTFAAYLGAVINGWIGALICLIAIFLPSFLLVIAALPFWEELRRRPIAQSALRGVNAAVVGLLLAAFYNPVWVSGVMSSKDFVLAAFAFLMLAIWKVAPWLVVALSVVAAGVMYELPKLMPNLFG